MLPYSSHSNIYSQLYYYFNTLKLTHNMNPVIGKLCPEKLILMYKTANFLAE